MKRSQPKRDWSDANLKRGPCRACGRTDAIQLHHLSGRKHDKPKFREQIGGSLYVKPDRVIPLCGPITDPGSCHSLAEAHKLDLVGALTPAEEAQAVLDCDGLENARVRLLPSAYRDKAAV